MHSQSQQACSLSQCQKRLQDTGSVCTHTKHTQGGVNSRHFGKLKTTWQCNWDTSKPKQEKGLYALIIHTHLQLDLCHWSERGWWPFLGQRLRQQRDLWMERLSKTQEWLSVFECSRKCLFTLKDGVV